MSQAQIAVRAAKNRYKWGRDATRRYCINRGIPLGLYFLACRLQASEKV